MLCYFDLEADGLLDQATQMWCGVFIEGKSGTKHVFLQDQVQEMLDYMDTCSILVAHNGIGYDMPLLKKLYGYDYKGTVIDTALMSRLQDPERKAPFNCPNKNRPHSLEAWGYRVGRGKPEHEDWTQYSEEMLHRCSEDVEILRLVHAALKEEGGPAWRDAHKLTHELFTVLQEQEQYGWLVDQDWIHKAISMLSHWIERIDKVVVPMLPYVLEIEESKKDGEYNYVRKPFLKSGKPAAIVENSSIDPVLVGGQFSRIKFRQVNLDSNAETKDWLLREGWKPEKWNYKKDKAGRKIKDEKGRLVKTSPILNGDDAFNGVEGKVGNLIAKRVQCRHRRSNLEGWLKLIRDDGRISQSIAGICTTARLKHRGIVNVPGGDSFFGKWMRKAFIAKDGYKIVGVDAAGCQNRMLAARVGDPEFTETLINGDKKLGTSIHQINQKAIAEKGFNVSYGNSKNLNYAFMFGASDNKLGEIIGESKEAGTLIREALLGVSTGFGSLVESLTKEWRSNAKTRTNDWGNKEYYNGWVTGLDGRPIFIASEHQVLVYMLQSDEAILMQTALVLLRGWLDDKGWTHGVEYGFVANIHDEYQAEVREDCIEEYCELATKAIVDAGKQLNIACPHEGEADVGVNWHETH